MNSIRRQALIRKLIYLGLILALFTVSLFWRGLIPIPFSDTARMSDPDRITFADRVNNVTILSQAKNLDLEESTTSDAGVATSAAQYSLVGFRGLIVSGLWWAAIEKQKRNEWHEFENLVRIVTHLQPNFVTPWIFQGWNISYNVSVENDKLGDMYYYIARGIELLAEGDRMNTKKYQPLGKEPVWVGSPDIRYQLGFYYQNKFENADKVNTLRCLMQLSCIKPQERDPQRLITDGEVNMAEFAEFCRKNPQLVRRLRTKLNATTPKDVVEFLKMNASVPTRYDSVGKLRDSKDQFPTLPESFTPRSKVPLAFTPTSETTDNFDAFHAARSWFESAQMCVPPPEGKFAAALPDLKKEDFEFRYRIPQSPSLIIFRAAPARAQSYLASRLRKEGWFDVSTTWDPDAGVDRNARWFGSEDDKLQPGGALVKSLSAVPLTSGQQPEPMNSQREWKNAYALWLEFGGDNAMLPSDVARYNQILDRVRVFQVGELPQKPANRYTDEELDEMFRGLDANLSAEQRRANAREIINAQRALVYYRGNVQVTSFPYFLAESEVESSNLLIAARKKQFEASQYSGLAARLKALSALTESMVLWRKACLQNRAAYHTSDRVQEMLIEAEMDIVNMVKDDVAFKNQLLMQRHMFQLRMLPEYMQIPVDPAHIAGIEFALTEQETQIRLAYKFLTMTDDEKLKARLNESAKALKQDAGFGMPLGREDDSPNEVERTILRSKEFAWAVDYISETEQVPWVRKDIRVQKRMQLGVNRPAPPPGGAPQPQPQELPR